MKINRFMLNCVKLHLKHGTKKSRKYNPPLDNYRRWMNINYAKDNNRLHCFDIIYAKGLRKNCLVIDIHGGGYIFGERVDNIPLALNFVNHGYDTIVLDYQYNNGKLSTYDLINDCLKCLKHISDNLEKYHLQNDKIILTGDSAGGHFALLLAEIILDPKLEERFNVKLNMKDKLVGVMVNSPVYDFVNIAKPLSRSGVKRMFGKDYFNREKMEAISPRNYIHGINVPLFVSTCKKDFLRSQSELLLSDLSNKEDLLFVDIDSDKVDHVHNVVNVNLKESKVVNKMMVEFADKLVCKK